MENETKEYQGKIRLSVSPNLKGIDALLLTRFPVVRIREMVIEQFGEDYGRRTLDRRRTELYRERDEQREQSRQEVDQREKDALEYQMQSLGKSAGEVLKLELPPEHPSYGIVKNFKEQVESFLRISAELFSEVDHLGYLRYSLNMMQMRIAKLYEIELKTGIPMRDNTGNLETFVNMISKSIEIHQSLGLKPKFGDPSLNLHINMESGGSATVSIESQNTRLLRLRALRAELDALPPEERERRRAEVLTGRVKVEDAKFREEPAVEPPDPPTGTADNATIDR